jgi:DNA-binding CsgD family transcriptional regulator
LRIARGVRPPLTLTIAPLVESAELVALAGDRGSLILISDPETRASPELTALLRQMFGLSPAEARLACLLERGLSLTDAARTLRVSDSTVRSQLKQVFAKMNVSRQSELASTIMDLDRIRPVPEES